MVRYFLATILVVALGLPQAAAFTYPTQGQKEAVQNLYDQRVLGSRDYVRTEEALNRAEAVTMLLRLQATEYIRDNRLPSPWVDVAADAWYRRSVETATQLGVIVPGSEKRFYPDRPVTRAEFLQMLYRLEKSVNGLTDPDLAVAKYTDTHPSDWFYTASLWAKANFLDGATAMASLDPAKPLSRGESVQLLHRYWLIMEGPSSSAWGKPLGDVRMEKPGNSYWSLTPVRTFSYTGPDLSYLPTDVHVYKEKTSSTISAETFTVPPTIQSLIPYLGTTLPLHTMRLETNHKDGTPVVVSFDPRISMLTVTLENRKVAGEGALIDQAERLAAKLGYDTRRLEKPIEGAVYSHSNVFFPLSVDGTPVYSRASGLQEFSLAYAKDPAPTMFIPLRQLTLRGMYEALTWKETLIAAEVLLLQACTASRGFLEEGHDYTSCSIVVTDALPVMLRYAPKDLIGSSLTHGESYLVPGVYLTVSRTRSTPDGEKGTSSFGILLPRVGEEN